VRLIRNHCEARWLPSRFHFATGRLIAWFLYRRTRKREQPGVILAVDRYQNQFESYIVAVGLLAASTCYAAAALNHVVHPAVAAVLALPTASIALQIAMNLSAAASALLRLKYPLRVNSIILMATVVAASVYFAISHSWARMVGRTFLALVALNALVAVASWPLRGRFAELERHYEAGA
jgi:hypothetical protein